MITQTIQVLREMRMSAMAAETERQLELPAMSALSFEERFDFIVTAEWEKRCDSKQVRFLKAANLTFSHACLADLDYDARRKLDKAQVARLSTLDWIERGHNLIITGACGTGKSFLASAFGSEAARRYVSTLSWQTNRLLQALSQARADGTWFKLLEKLKKPKLLILDDFGLCPLSAEDCRDLLEVIDDRYRTGSLIIASQAPVSAWHDLFADKTIADAVLDRIVHNAYRFELKGASLRRQAQSEMSDLEGSD